MKRIFAIICVAVLIISVIVMLFAAITGSPQSNEIFVAALAVNIILPVMMWVYLQTAHYLKRKGDEIRQSEETNNQKHKK